MNCLPFVLYLMPLLDSALTSLPAPVNVTVISVNFHHVLRWDPGSGTPPGTQYKIYRRVSGGEKRERSSTTTSCKLKLDNKKTYYLTVRAFHNQTLSAESSKVTFTPYRHTKIGPPKLSLAGCGNCIQINITLPEADRSSRINDIQEFYDAKFRVLWRKHKEAVETSETENKSLTLGNLQSGVEYCVQVQIKIRVNKNTKPSAWNCTFTSIAEVSRGPAVLGAVAALLILVIVVLMTSMLCLYYTGFLCKLKTTLPRTLIAALSPDSTLTPEKTLPDQISISPHREKQGKYNNPTTPHPATGGSNTKEEEDEEEEDGEEGLNVYMDRAAELSLGERPCQSSGDVAGNGALAESRDAKTWEGEKKVRDGEFEVEVTHGRRDGDGADAERAEVSVMPEGGQTEVQGHVIGEVEKEKEELCDNVNLYSVTLAALAICDGEEEEEEEGQNTRHSLSDFWKLSDLEPLLPTDTELSLSHTASQTVSDGRRAVADVLPTQEDFTATGYNCRHADTLSDCFKSCDDEAQLEETQEEEEEEGPQRYCSYRHFDNF